MSALHRFTIHAPLTPTHAYVEMDGKRLEGVTEARFAIRANSDVTKIELTIMGYVDVTGEFREREIISVSRDAEHSAALRARVRRAFKKQFPEADDVEVKSFTDLVMVGIEET